MKSLLAVALASMAILSVQVTLSLLPSKAFILLEFLNYRQFLLSQREDSLRFRIDCTRSTVPS
jgi:hypothetical protein